MSTKRLPKIPVARSSISVDEISACFVVFVLSLFSDEEYEMRLTELAGKIVPANGYAT